MQDWGSQHETETGVCWWSTRGKEAGSYCRVWSLVWLVEKEGIDSIVPL